MAAANSASFKIILGSKSVARRKILSDMGYQFTVMTADIDERSIRRENPEELVSVLAKAKVVVLLNDPDPFEAYRSPPPFTPKADAIISRLDIADYKRKDREPTLLITSDIVVVHEGIIREKPSSEGEAWEFLKGYSGGHVSTVGSVVITNLKTGARIEGLDTAEVYFHDIPNEIIAKLIEERVVFNVAGGLLLEHPLTLPFVEAVVGASDGVMGLSISLTEDLIRRSLSSSPV